MTTVNILPLGDSNTRGKLWDPAGYRDNLWELIKDDLASTDITPKFVGSLHWAGSNPKPPEPSNNDNTPDKTPSGTYKFKGEAETHGGWGAQHISLPNLPDGKDDPNDIISRFEKNESTLLKAAADYQVVLLMAGSNDLNGTSGNKNDASKTARDLVALIQTISANNPDAYILVSTIPEKPGDTEFEQFNNYIRGKLSLSGVEPIDSLRRKGIKVLLVDPKDVEIYTGDPTKLHPSKLGYENIAKAWNKALGFDSAGNSDGTVSNSQASESQLLLGFGGDDTLKGGIRDDILVGGPGKDILDGGQGIDTADFSDIARPVQVNLLSGKVHELSEANLLVETDTLVSIENVVGSNFNDAIIGNHGSNTLVGHKGQDILRGLNGHDILVGGAGRDILDGGEGIDTAVFSDIARPVQVNLLLGKVSELGEDTYPVDTDTLSSIENVIGSTFNDFIVGDHSNNKFYGSEGDDTLAGVGGNDLLSGGPGRDIAHYFGTFTDFGGINVDLGMPLNQVKKLNSSQTTVIGTDTLNSIEVIRGSRFNDVFQGNSDDNVFYGMDGNDTINGGGGNDVLRGGKGNDNINGGGDIDVIPQNVRNLQRNGLNSNNIHSLSTSGMDSRAMTDTDIDTVDYIKSIGPVSVSLAQGIAIEFNTDGNKVSEDTLTSIENVIGSKYDDSLAGDEGNNKLDGGEGNDTLDGKQGVDIVSYALANGKVEVNLTQKVALEYDPSGNQISQDRLQSIEDVIGSRYDDILVGSNQDNTLFGGGGNDVLDGNVGADYLTGGGGNDTFVLASGDGADTITDFSTATDTLQLEGGLTKTDLRVEQGNNNSANHTLIWQNSNNQLLAILQNTNAEKVKVLLGIMPEPSTPGTPGTNPSTPGTPGTNPSTPGTPGTNPSTPSTPGTAPSTPGSPGTAPSTPGSPNSEGKTAEAPPPIIFDRGKKGKTYRGTNQRDVFRGTRFRDKFLTKGGNDKILAGGGNDSAKGQGGNDIILGGNGNDRLNGGHSKDKLKGGNGFDQLKGGRHKDLLMGQSGNDVLIGEKGRDLLSGGTGDDVFRFNRLSEKGDRITDFLTGNNIIDIRGIMAADTYAAENSFQKFKLFLELRQSGAHTQVLIDGVIGSEKIQTVLVTLDDVDKNLITSEHFLI